MRSISDKTPIEGSTELPEPTMKATVQDAYGSSGEPQPRDIDQTDRGGFHPDGDAEAAGSSPKRLARIAGALYLLVGIFGGFAQGFLYPKIYVAGDAAKTAANLVDNSGLVRAGVVADLFQATVWVCVAMTLYVLLKHVNTSVARAMVVFAGVGAGITCLNAVFEYEALRVATGKLGPVAVGSVGSNGLAMLLVDTQHYGVFVAQIFFGLWLAPMGYLAYKSGWFPKALGILLIIACVSYLVDLLVAFLVPDLGKEIHGFAGVLPAIAEVWMVGYLLVIGVKTGTARPPTSVVRVATH
jgi:Domain of unknown function (DUF4386)